MLNFLNRVKTQIYNSLEYILIAGLIVLALIFIATSIYVFSLVVILPSNYSLEGLSNLYNYFNVPVKLLAGIFALIAIILTIGRMDQTKKQIEVMTSNNNFNNYFKYQELFKELMLSGTLLNRRGKLSEGIINAVFRDLYGSSPKYFNGKLKSGKEELCKDVFSFFIEVEKKSKKVSNEESDDFRENMRALS